MLTILNVHPHRIFPTRAAAEALARDVQADDPDWRYRARQLDDGRWIVAVLDEDRRHVGNL